MNKRTKPIFINFVEEGIQNPAYFGWVGGRIEVFDARKAEKTNGFATDELRFFTKRARDFDRFRAKWDFKDISDKEFKSLSRTIKEKYNEHK